MKDRTLASGPAELGPRTIFNIQRFTMVSADKNFLRLAVVNVILLATFSVLAPDYFLSSTNFLSMAVQMTGFGIFALAMLVPMLTGGIDLSVISLANLSAIIGALTINALVAMGDASPLLAQYALPIGLALTISIGVMGGIVNGTIIARIGVSPILATLATSLIFLGIALVITGGSAVTGLPPSFAWIGSGAIANVPVPLIVFGGAALVVAFLLKFTSFGAKVYLFGTNPLASRFAGINNEAITLKAYVLSGVLAAVAGLIISARASSAKADYATSYLLLSILVCVLGGINPMGGKGKVLGVILAVIALQILSSGLNILNVSNFATDFVWGAVLLLVMCLNQLGETRRS